MNAGLTQQLAGYGDLFAAEVDALTRETIKTTDQAVISIDKNERDQKKSPWVRVGALVGAAAVAIVAIGGLALLRSDSSVVAAPPYATAEDAAMAIEKAVTLGDWDAYRAAFSDDATDWLVSSGRVMGENEQVAEARFGLVSAFGTNTRIDSCEVTTENTVACRVEASDALSEALGSEPYVDTVVYTISGGLVVYTGERDDREPSAVFAAFDAWMEETSHGAGAAAGDFYKDPVGKDPDIVVAGLIGAADEFLAQYEG
jgi:hypothetical protein